MITAFEDLPWFLRKLLKALLVALVHEMQQPSAVGNQTDLVGKLLGLVRLPWNETLVVPSLLLTQSAEGTELSLRSVTHLVLPPHVGMDREALQLTGHAGERSGQTKALSRAQKAAVSSCSLGSHFGHLLCCHSSGLPLMLSSPALQ